jgi:Helix-turn-helix domain
MSKTVDVLNHLKKRPITSWEAITKYRATRLADIIFKLRGRGFNISTELVENGSIRYARYRLSK